MTTRAYVRFVCPTCGEHRDVRLKYPTITCPHPRMFGKRPALMVRADETTDEQTT